MTRQEVISVEERRHRELLAATIAAGFVSHGYSRGEGDASEWDHVMIPVRAVRMALAVQREMRDAMGSSQ